MASRLADCASLLCCLYLVNTAIAPRPVAYPVRYGEHLGNLPVIPLPLKMDRENDKSLGSLELKP